LLARIPTWGRPHTARPMQMYTSLVGVSIHVVFPPYPHREEGEGYLHIFKVFKCRGDIDFFGSKHMYFAFVVLKTLFHRILDIVIGCPRFSKMQDACVRKCKFSLQFLEGTTHTSTCAFLAFSVPGLTCVLSPFFWWVFANFHQRFAILYSLTILYLVTILYPMFYLMWTVHHF
jgi:hypothetical protein